VDPNVWKKGRKMVEEANKLKTLPKEPWYKDGLHFECTGCGKCCSGPPGYVWLSEQDIDSLSTHLNITQQVFIKEYTRSVNGRLSLLEKFRSYGEYNCIFLEGKLCKVYQARPVQCRTFPWWPRVLESQEEWMRTSTECEGIRSDAPIVPKEEIAKQLGILNNAFE
jgi:hypothetical protein